MCPCACGCVQMKHDDIWEYVRAAVDYNNYKLTQMMLDFVCAECPRALADCNWEDTLGPLIACFPDLFHGLLRKLQVSSAARRVKSPISCDACSRYCRSARVSAAAQRVELRELPAAGITGQHGCPAQESAAG